MESQLKVRQITYGLFAKEKNGIKQEYKKYWLQGKLINEDEKKKITRIAKERKPFL